VVGYRIPVHTGLTLVCYDYYQDMKIEMFYISSINKTVPKMFIQFDLSEVPLGLREKNGEKV
jgi:hypothetical protein